MIFDPTTGRLQLILTSSRDMANDARDHSLIISNEQVKKDSEFGEIGNSYFPELYDYFE